MARVDTKMIVREQKDPNFAYLMSVKRDIEDAKTKLSQSQGQLDYLMRELKEEHQCESIEAAEKMAESLSVEIDTITEALTELIESIKEEYDAIDT